jgi:hypothetical protein
MNNDGSPLASLGWLDAIDKALCTLIDLRRVPQHRDDPMLMIDVDRTANLLRQRISDGGDLDKAPMNMARSNHFYKTHDPGKTEADKEKAAEKDKSFVGSLDRIAKRWRESAKQGGHSALAEGAKALEDEADFLDPSRVKDREEKEKLAKKHEQEAKDASTKADASRADANAG